MIVLITGASHTGKTALAQKHKQDYVLIDDEYRVDVELHCD